MLAAFLHPLGLPYDESIAQTDIWLNQAVGCKRDDIERWNCGLACDSAPTLARLVAANDSMHTFALTARITPSECVVVFRGRYALQVRTATTADFRH